MVRNLKNIAGIYQTILNGKQHEYNRLYFCHLRVSFLFAKVFKKTYADSVELAFSALILRENVELWKMLSVTLSVGANCMQTVPYLLIVIKMLTWQSCVDQTHSAYLTSLSLSSSCCFFSFKHWLAVRFSLCCLHLEP